MKVIRFCRYVNSDVKRNNSFLKRPFCDENKNMKRTILIPILLTLFFVPCSAQDQQKQNRNIFASVPAKMRERLEERLKLLVDYQSKCNWSNVYELMLKSFQEKMSKEEFIKTASSNNSQRIVDFMPLYIKKGLRDIKGESWLIIGDVKIIKAQGAQELLKENGVVFAQYQDNDWYFTTIEIPQRKSVMLPPKSIVN